MSRSRKTDHDTAIKAARDVFWRYGYAGTSTRQLEETTGLTRFTLQTAYGGKEAFFLETLDAYLDHAETQHFPNPENTDLEVLAVWFEHLGEVEMMPRIGDNGCLLFNTITEFDRSDPKINARIERYYTCLQGRFVQILRNAVENGEADPELDPEEKARVLVCLLLGLSATVKARTNDGFPQSYAGAIAATVREWKMGT